MKPEALIDDWQMCVIGSNKCLHGLITGHVDGNGFYDKLPTIGITSPIIDSDFKTFAETQNTMYTLGKQKGI